VEAAIRLPIEAHGVDAILPDRSHVDRRRAPELNHSLDRGKLGTGRLRAPGAI
jgi:hypothetical protein